MPQADLAEWEAVVAARKNPEAEVTIAMVGKYVDLRDSYISLTEALIHAGLKTRTRVRIRYIESQDIEKDGTGGLVGVDAILVPGGFGERGIEGKIAAVRYARENGVPYLGICLGLQVAVIEFARNVLGLKGAHSTEFDPQSPHPVIALISEWQDRDGSLQKRDTASSLGGTMRLGAQECRLQAGTLAHDLYGTEIIRERHRHRFEFNNNYLDQMSSAGLVVRRILDRRAGGTRRAAGSPLVPGLPVPSGIPLQSPGRPSALQWFCPRCPQLPGRGAARRGPRMKLAGVEVGADRPLFLIAGPCVVETETLAVETAGRLQEITRRLNIPFVFKSSYDKANRSSLKSYRGPGIEEGLRVLESVRRQLGVPVLTDVHEDSPARRSGRRGGRAPDAGISLPADQFHHQRRASGQARQHQEGPVSVALGDGQRRGQGREHRQPRHHGLRARLQLRLQQSGHGHAVAGGSAGDRAACRVRRHPFRAAARGQGRRVGWPAGVRAGAGPRGRRRGRGRHLHGDAPGSRRARCPTARTPGRCT